MVYQPKIKDNLIRKLYFRAKREGRPMTRLVNEVIEQALINEPEPPAYGNGTQSQDDTPLNESNHS